MVEKKILNYQDLWSSKIVRVDELLLDPLNIRLENRNLTQEEIINDLFANEDAMQILQNIYENGYYPDEPPVVVKEKQKFYVIDGNRRVVSLKAMLRPGIAPKDFTSRISKMMKNFTPISQIEVRVATNREDAQKYLAAKHTKNTRRPWSALRRAYFYYAQKEGGQTVDKLIERYKGVDIPRYIKMYEMHHIAMSLDGVSDETRKKIFNKRSFQISTLERFYSDPYVQDWLNIEFDSVTGEVRVPKTKAFDKVYSCVITDIVEKIATSRKQLETEKSRKIYIEGVIREILGGEKVKKSNISVAEKFKERKITGKVVKTRLVPSNILSTLDCSGISRVLWELQNIEYKRFPNASADTLRTFLEIVLKDYLKKTQRLPNPRRNGGYIYLEDVLNKMEQELRGDTQNRGLVQVIQELKQSKWYLDSINHNPDVFAVDYRVEEAWDQMKPLVEYVFRDYKQRQEQQKNENSN